MTCPTVTATRELLVIEWMRRFVPSIRAALGYDFAASMWLLRDAGDVCLASGRDIEDCIREAVELRGGTWCASAREV